MPKFIIDYFKQTGSKFLRRFEAPNQRLQDGIKKHYLSHDAEQFFSVKEKWFAERIFKPFLEKGESNFRYDEQLHYFLISVLWRGLLYQLEFPSIYNDPALDILKVVELDWREYLSDGKQTLTFPDVNLWLTDHIKSHDTGIKGLDYYFTRTIDFTIICDPKGDYIIVYGKFLKFVFWSTIKDVSNFNNSAVRVQKSGGIIEYPQPFRDSQFIETLVHRAKQISELPGPSHSQEEKIIGEVKKNSDAFINSDAGKSIMNDWRLDNPSNYLITRREMSHAPAEVGKSLKNAIGQADLVIVISQMFTMMVVRFHISPTQ